MQRKIELLNYTSTFTAITAARTCTDTEDQIDKDLSVLHKCIRKGHESVLEHIVYTFKLEGFSRALLQELARHRIASLSVMSTRWTLKKMLSEGGFHSDYLMRTGDPDVDAINTQTLHKIIDSLKDKPNDIRKYALPEAIKTKCVLTINLRSFRNLLKLRTAKDALPEFQELAYAMAGAVPGEHYELIKDMLYGGEA